MRNADKYVISKVSIYFGLAEVVERSSPPAPVEILPSNAGQDIAPTLSAGENKTPLITSHFSVKASNSYLEPYIRFCCQIPLHL